METRNFLESTGEVLRTVNLETAQKILAGQIQMSGETLDGAMMHKEQTQVQKQLDAFQTVNPEGYGNAIKEINVLLNPGQRSGLQTALGGVDKVLFGTDKALDALLSGVKKSLGHDIDFAYQKDREARGKALVNHVRTTGGCDVSGDKVAGCK